MTGLEVGVVAIALGIRAALAPSRREVERSRLTAQTRVAEQRLRRLEAEALRELRQLERRS